MHAVQLSCAPTQSADVFMHGNAYIAGNGAQWVAAVSPKGLGAQLGWSMRQLNASDTGHGMNLQMMA